MDMERKEEYGRSAPKRTDRKASAICNVPAGKPYQVPTCNSMIVIIVGLSKPFACFFLCFALSLLSYTSKNEVSGFQLSAEIALTHRRKPTIRHAIRRRLQFFTDQSHVLPSFLDSLQRRLLAASSFITKCVVEVSLAALTQL